MKKLWLSLTVAMLAATIFAGTASAATTVSWSTYLSHIIAISTREQAAVQDMVDAGNSYDVFGLAYGATELRQITSHEKTWLAQHKPRSCFAKTYARRVKATATMLEAATRIARYWGSYPYGVQYDYSRGNYLIARANSEIASETAALKATHC